MAENNSLLAEAAQLSKDLAAVGATGLKALEYLEGSQPAPNGWLAAETAEELTRVQSPRPT